MKPLLSFLQSKTNESLKRLIAFIFAIVLIVAYFTSNNPDIDKLILYGFFGSMWLLLGLATVETIVSMFKK